MKPLLQELLIQPFGGADDLRKRFKERRGNKYAKPLLHEHATPAIDQLPASKLAGSVHAELIQLDLPPYAFRELDLSHLRSLDASRVGMSDEDVVALASNRSLGRLRWLSLKGSPITREGVAAICRAVSDGRLPALTWLDLTATECEATPYLDGDAERTRWRMPRAAHQLRAEFGTQAWMTLGSHEPDAENEEYVDTADYPPSRFG